MGEGVWVKLFRAGCPVVQEAQVAGVDVAFERLQPVALAQDGTDEPLAVRQHVGIEVGQRRWRRARPHVRPDHTAAFSTGIRGHFDLVLEVALRRLVRHVDAVAVHVELPAVIDAAQPTFLVSAEEHRGAAVRTVVVDQAYSAVAVAEGDELLTQQQHAHRIAVRPLQL